MRNVNRKKSKKEFTVCVETNWLQLNNYCIIPLYQEAQRITPSIKLIKWNDRWNTAIRINSYDKTSSFGKFFRRKGRNPLTKMKKLGNFFANYFYKKFASRIVKAYRRSIFLSVHRFKYDMQLSLHTGKSILNAKIFAH